MEQDQDVGAGPDPVGQVEEVGVEFSADATVSIQPASKASRLPLLRYRSEFVDAVKNFI